MSEWINYSIWGSAGIAGDRQGMQYAERGNHGCSRWGSQPATSLNDLGASVPAQSCS